MADQSPPSSDEEVSTHTSPDSTHQSDSRLLDSRDGDSSFNDSDEDIPLPSDSESIDEQSSPVSTTAPTLSIEVDNGNRSPFTPEETLETENVPIVASPPPPTYSALRKRTAPPAYDQVRQQRGQAVTPGEDTESPSASTALLEQIEMTEGTGPEARPTVQPPAYHEVIYTTFASGEAETTFSGADAEVSDEGMADRLPPHYREVTESHDTNADNTDADVERQADVTDETLPEDEGSFGRLLRCCSGSVRRNFIIACAVCACLVFTCIFFPFQVSYVDYHQFGLVRTKSTGRVDVTRVYESGCYVLGVDREFVYIQQSVTPITFSSLSMFTADNVDLSIDMEIYYTIDQDKVGEVWKDYAGKHHRVFQAMVRSTIRNLAPQISQNDYITRRSYVEQLLQRGVIDKLSPRGVVIRSFTLLQIHLPERVTDLRLNIIITRIQVEKEQYILEKKLVDLETERLEQPILYEAKEVANNATYQAAAIGLLSKTDKEAVLNNQHAKSLRGMTTQLNVSNPNHTLSFMWLSALNNMDNLAGAVEYGSLKFFHGRK